MTENHSFPAIVREEDKNVISAEAPKKKSTRGFASMDPAKQREIARKGGKAAHEKGTAHEFTPEEARLAGRKGGEAVSRDRNHMAEIGREGGQARGAKAARRNLEAQAKMGQVHQMGKAQEVRREREPEVDQKHVG